MTATTPTTPPPGPVRALALSLSSDQLPAYVYDLTALGEHARAVRAALPEGVELYYAAKANAEPAVLRVLAPYLDGCEISSGGELAHVARALPNRPLAFGGPGKTPAEIADALDRGVARFHVESRHELAVLAHLAARPGRSGRPVRSGPVGVLLRVNLPIDTVALDSGALTMGGRPTPFGMAPAEAEAAAGLLAGGGLPGLELLGVHAHLASGLAAPELLGVAGAVVDWAAGLAGRHGFRLREVNIGGGMTVDYTDPTSRFDWTAYGQGLSRLLDGRPGLVLRIEPGRALTAYCGWYATEILDVKGGHGEEFAVVRGGTHHLRTPAAKGHDQPCAVLPVDDWPHPWPRPRATGELLTLAGQLCTPKDVLARRVPARGLRAGDRVVFALAGAYAWNISHHEFLMHPRPGFHFVGDGAEP